ncbi:Gustatory receptor for sugar taste 43a [Pseudolycoriella hygida]|uniref:Gustatory receptor n=1 Tax=Pseudolycoriella hygida TaxID=35572 RepID=A0A9Q0RW45_9DIPT|nr:Gustatory receptor for sugar taste 43a [Pseudolycoriella hygida]
MMEISEPTLIVFYASRIFGYAPYRLERNASGKITRIISSLVMKSYSIALLFTLVVLCTIGLTNDVEATVSLRMKSTTSRIATVFDVNVVVASCLFGVVSGNIGFRQMLDINRRIKEVDDILFIYIGRDKQAKSRAIKLVLTVYALILSILVNIVNNLYWYIPFYTLYVFLMTLEIQFAHTSWGLGTRYRRLNFALNKMFLKEKSFIQASNVGFTTATINEYRKNENVTNALRRDHAAYLHNIYLKNFAYIHESLGKVVVCISSYFGLALLMLLSSCLLHLIVTAYFLILSLMDEADIDPFHITLQCIWLTFHTFRLLLIVEPCNLMSVELESFWQQLLADETQFTAYGICKIDRGILTTLLWTITTYLVILLQFQKIYG